MHVRYRTIASHPPQAHSPTSRKEHLDGSVYVMTESICVAIISNDIHFVSALELCRGDRIDTMDVASIFHMLESMPYLQDLTIDFDSVVPAPRTGTLPLLPFRLRRLVVCPLFPGAAHLLRCSSETLECLVLGDPSDTGFAHTHLLGDLSRFINIRALRFQTMPDARFIVSAPRRLCALAIPSNLDLARSISQQLSCLTVLYSKFDDEKALTLAEALSLCPALRTLDIETDTVDACPDAKDAGWTALADVCRRRGICVSLMRARAPAKWEKLEEAPRRLR